MKLNVFLLLVFLAERSTQFQPSVSRTYLDEEEEDVDRIKYMVVENPDGTLHFEDLTNITVKADAKESDLSYHLYTRETEVGIDITSLNKSILRNHFKKGNEVLILVHNWWDTGNSVFGATVKTAVLKKVDLNVIMIDWGKIAMLGYRTAFDNVRKLGKFAADFFKNLISMYRISLSEVSIVGYSLGAHLAGCLGDSLNSSLGPVDHIVGLDPAQPLSSNDILGYKRNTLNSSHANYVQVIHTNTNFLGLRRSVGHADYFPNGGSRQTGCIGPTGQCSHRRSYLFYAESMSNIFLSRNCASYKEFKSKKCKGKYAYMGSYKVYKE